MYGTTYSFQEEDATYWTSCGPFDLNKSIRQFPSSKDHRYNKCGYEKALTRSKEEDLTTRLSPSSLPPVYFNYDTINGHTPMILATTSTKWGIPKSLVKMAFLWAGRADIQARDSKFGHGKPVETTEHTRRFPLQTAFEQRQIKNWVVN